MIFLVLSPSHHLPFICSWTVKYRAQNTRLLDVHWLLWCPPHQKSEIRNLNKFHGLSGGQTRILGLGLPKRGEEELFILYVCICVFVNLWICVCVCCRLHKKAKRRLLSKSQRAARGRGHFFRANYFSFLIQQRLNPRSYSTCWVSGCPSQTHGEQEYQLPVQCIKYKRW